MYVKRLYTIGTALALGMLVWGSPALALEQDVDSGMQSRQADGSYAGDGSGEPQNVTCPNCGRNVVIGRHGQTGKTGICPYCGKEVCEPEEAGGICFGADAGLFNKYVSRGVTLNEDPVFQPDVWASYRGVTLNVWGNMDLTDVNDNEAEFNELDFTLEYSGRWEALGYSAGGIYYVFPNTEDRDTAELYASLGYDALLNPTLTVFYDFVEADGFYVVLGIGHGFGIPLPIDAISASLELAAQAGWGSRNFNEFNAGVHKDAFTDLVLTASLPVTFGEHLTVSPMVSWSSALDTDIRAANENNDNVIWGATLSASF